MPQIDAAPDHSTPQASTIDIAAPPPGPAQPTTVDPLLDFPDFDRLFDSFPPAAPANVPTADSMFEPELAAASVDVTSRPVSSPDDSADFDELVIEDFPQHDDEMDAGATPPLPRATYQQTDAAPESFFDDTDLDAPPADLRPQSAAVPSVAPAGPLPVPPPAAPPRGWSKQMTMGLLGVAAGGVVIFALMSARGAASPEAAAVKPAGSRPQRTAPTAPQALPAVVPQWTSNAVGWVGNDRRAAAFELAALDKAQVWMRSVQPMLVVRCRAKAIEAFVFTDSPAKMEPQDGDHTVRIRFDEQPEITQRWPDSAEHDALFAPDSATFVRQLVAARALQFTFSPHNAGDARMRFNVAGLAAHLTAAARQCGWKN